MNCSGLFVRNLRKLCIVSSNRSYQMDLKLKEIFYASVNAVKPKQIVEKNQLLKFVHTEDRQREFIEIRKTQSDSLKLDITDKKIHIVGFGKGVLSLCREFEIFLGEKLTSGILSVPINALKYHSLSDDSKIKIYEGAAGNLPDESALNTAKLIKDKVSCLNDDDILFVLVSGGGSALLPLPIEPITLNEKLQLITRLSRAGATINELNTVRIAISQVKGGKLAQIGKNAHRIVSFIISDIVSDPLHLVSSGPTIINNNTQEEEQQSTREILEKYNLFSSLSTSIYDVLTQQQQIKSQNHDQTIQKEDSVAILIANNRIAIDAAMEKAKELHLIPVFMSSKVQGDVEVVSLAFFKLAQFMLKYKDDENNANFLEQIEEISKILSAEVNFTNDLVAALKAYKTNNAMNGICIVSGGETTVKVKGDGLGGRNQELTLRFTQLCLEHQQKDSSLNDLWLLSAGTDGFDGNNDAAGALGGVQISTNTNSTEKISQNIIKDFINRNDSYNFYKKYANDRYHIITGHTGTNVMDLHLLSMTR